MLNVKIATPSQKIFDGQLEKIVVQTTDGEITILPKHVPFISTIENGRVVFGEETVTIKKGAVIFSDNNLEILGSL